MALWKTALLASIVAVSFFFARRYFDLVAIVAGLLWVTEFFRSRAEARGRDRRVSVAPLAEALGITSRPQLSSFKIRWNDVPVRIAGHFELDVAPETDMVTFSSPLFRKAPFCFVVRRTDCGVRESQLVENTRIPGIEFEYALQRVELPQPLEAAANMPELLRDVLAEAGTGEGIDRRGPLVQKVYCNGSGFHTRFLLKPGIGRPELAPLLDHHVFFHLTLTGIIGKVDFKVPM